MSVQRYHEGQSYYFARKSDDGRAATWAGHLIGWGDEGKAPKPEYPIKVVARIDETMPSSMQGRILKSPIEALGFVRRARGNCVLLDAKGRYAGHIFYHSTRSQDRSLLIGRTPV